MKGFVLVTGVSSGIGLNSVKKFIEEGYHVFGSVRKLEDAQPLIDAHADKFTPLLFDVTDNDAIQSAFKIVKDHVGEQGLTCLVNNAGIALVGPMAYFPLDELRKQFEINVIGLLNVTQTFLPLLGFGENNPLPKGTLINISSGAGKVVRPLYGPYSASKHAVEAISDALRREISEFGLRVIIIEPGPIKTEIWTKVGKKDYSAYLNTVYRKYIENKDRILNSNEEISIPARDVADLIFKAFNNKNPKTRYLIAPKRWLYWLAIHVLSDKTLDKLFRKQMKSLTSEN